MASHWEELNVAGASMPAYVSKPEGQGVSPAMVVIHHASGVDEFVREFSDRLARQGYTAVAPDLFHRITDEMAKRTGKARRDLLSDPEIIADVNATVDFLSGRPDVDSGQLGITGFCMGGRVTWLSAAANPDFKAAVSHYGGNIMVPWGDGEHSPFELSGGIGCPVLFHFGEEDANPSQDDMRKLDDELTRLGTPHRFYTYPGAGHAFMNHTDLSRFHRRSAEMAWARTVEFLAAHLKPAGVFR
jgi:carboxymethylenebutenolidase